MSPNLIAAARRLEPHVRKLDSIVVPLATGGGRGIETSEEDLTANLRTAITEMTDAARAAEKLL
jgi:hypothetical protein